MKRLSEIAVNNPSKFMWSAFFISVVMIVIVALPSFYPKTFSLLSPVKIDTDPENMLSKDEPVRVYHNRMKEEFSLYDIIVVGVVNDSHKNGVFNADTLKNVYDLVETAKQIKFDDQNGASGVISADILSPSTVDNIEQAGLGSVSFNWLMKKPPQNDEEAAEIAVKASKLPLLDNTLVSEDKKALAIYIPITSKDVSYKTATILKDKIADFKGNEEYHITGLPVAQDTFGVEMFKQMAISAPLAMLLIFLLMLYFFRNLNLIISPMIVALVSVVVTMGLLVATGNTVHIMSSMIPVFIMPIAVLDAVHILSDFFDCYPRFKNRRKTLEHVMDELSKPMLFTTLTTAAGFGSLAFTPIPPVQVFGIFISLGVVVAWFLTVTLIPAYIMLMSESSLKKLENVFGKSEGKTLDSSKLSGVMQLTGRFTYKHAKLIIVVMLLSATIAVYGISKIRINDNPVKWFTESHPIRVADKVLNEKFAGTYMAYLTLSAPESSAKTVQEIKEELLKKVRNSENPEFFEFERIVKDISSDLSNDDADVFYSKLSNEVMEMADNADSDLSWEAWDSISLMIGEQQQSSEIFKDPQVLRFIEKLQLYLGETGLVGKSNALPDIVKTVHRELFLGNEKEFKIPDSRNAVAQTLITYQNSHRPDDLWHFVNPSYDRAVIWLQLKSGDNIDMNKVINAVDKFMSENKSPVALDHDWFGLTYINVVWQAKMVEGMMKAFLGSFVIVLLMMIFLFRSLLWGVLSMVPLTVTIGFIYGIIGIIGKDYDMPVAVLSSLSLGLAVDYAIHFIARSREKIRKHGSWDNAISDVFGEPARAITRNVIIIGIGFTPLLLAPLVPYKTVGVFISAILLLAGFASLIILPALIRLMSGLLGK